MWGLKGQRACPFNPEKGFIRSDNLEQRRHRHNGHGDRDIEGLEENIF